MQRPWARTTRNTRISSDVQRCSASQGPWLSLGKCMPLYAALHRTCKSTLNSRVAKTQTQQEPMDLLMTTSAATATHRDVAARAAAATTQQQTRSHQHHQQQRITSPSVQVPVAAASALQLLRAGSAAAAKIELEVPDFLVENNPLDIVLQSPVFAIAAAVLVLILFPKFIRTTINYIFYPAIAALLAYLAISHPEETASSIYYVLEFVKDHPAASSVAVIAAAGILLGPDVLAGTAVAGVLVLLAAQAGMLQLPKPPELPKLPGQQVVSKQLEKAGKALQQKMEDLDEGRPLLPAAVLSRQQQWQQQQQQQQERDYSSSSSSSWGKHDSDRYSRGRLGQDDNSNKSQAASTNGATHVPPPQQQQQPLKAAAMPAAIPLSQQQQQEEDVVVQSPAEGPFQSLKGLGQKLGTASKGLVRKAAEALPEQEQVRAGLSTVKSSLLSATQKIGSGVQGLGDKVQQSGLGPKIQNAGKELGSRVQGLGDKLQQAGLESSMQDVQRRAGAAAAGAFGNLQEGLQQQQRAALPRNGVRGQGPSQQQQPVETADASIDSSSAVAPAAAADGESSSRIDSILANS